MWFTTNSRKSIQYVKNSEKSTVWYEHWHREETGKDTLEMTRQSQQAFTLERKESFFGNYTQRSKETKGNIALHKTKENLKIKGNMTMPKPCHPVKKQYFACSDRIECTSTRNIITTPTHWKNNNKKTL